MSRWDVQILITEINFKYFSLIDIYGPRSGNRYVGSKNEHSIVPANYHTH
jgi:hypothetical protein